MAKFFINRPIVAMVIAILMVILGLVAMVSLPIAQFPNLAPPEIQISATYNGADALTMEQAVATPIEQQMSGVDNMTYMYSINTNSGNTNLRVDFDVTTDPNTDQILSQMRETQAASQLPTPVNNFGITVQKSTVAPLIMFALYSPKGTYDNVFLANYAYINLNDKLTRTKGISTVSVFGAGQYAMRIWVKPDKLASLDITIPEIVNAIQAQNTVNPAGQIGGEPIPTGQEFTYALRAQGRLQSEEDFGNVILRVNKTGSTVRIKDVGRIELGAQNYSVSSRLNGQPTALIALYQLPGSNALDAANGAKALMAEQKKSFPADLDYAVALDTTLAVTAGIDDIVQTLFEALVLVIIVVYLFLQSWRATLIPLLAVPVALIGTFAFFPLFGFSINTLSLFGLVLAVGLVIDDAIVVVEAVEHHIEKGLSPKDAALKAMEEVSGPVIAIAIILSAVFIPTAFIPGITGRLYQPFAVTMAVSVALSAFNALTLTPALCALMLKPKAEQKSTSLLQRFFDGFNRIFGRITDGYVGVCNTLIRRSFFGLMILLALALSAGFLGHKIPASFLPDEDQGYIYGALQLPNASSLQRTSEIAKQVEDVLKNTPGVKYYSTVLGYNMLSQANTTYNAFFFITLDDWANRTAADEQYTAIKLSINKELRKLPGAIALVFPPPAIPGVGTSGGVSFVLEDRGGSTVEFLAENTEKFIKAAQQRPELTGIFTTLIAATPQLYVDVDKDKVIKQGVNLADVYQTMQYYMGSGFINYFNRFGRQWQVYLEAEGEYRKTPEPLGQFYVRNKSGTTVPLSAVTNISETSGPEFTMRYNLYRSALINAAANPGYTSAQAMQALEEVFAQTMPSTMGYDYMGMSYQEKIAQQGLSPIVIFGFSLLCVFLILAALYESWSLPFSVLLGTPIAIFGAFAALMVGQYANNVYAQIGLVMLIGLAAKNAILIVEFAKMGVEQGKPIIDATLEGARVRLRPILMTSFAFILGCVPLALADGAGALGRQVIGYVVIGGMATASFIAIFFVPLSFYVVEKLSHRKKTEIIVDNQKEQNRE
ncbi:MAG: multidrug efflux RND transporter permease subunit [Methylococcales bacterium]|nr:multidrug efflux RND transporter permease subunit [Methylococcales bacterium]